jgi:uncharacterized protein (TIGR02594 family)
MISAPWMAIARAELGEREAPGAASNPRIVEYLACCKGGDKPWAARDSTPHCAAFVSWCMLAAGQPATRALNARSWLRYGDPVAVEDARAGDVLIFWRHLPLPASVLNAPGHVGFFVAWGPRGQVQTLGANQGNCVSVRAYPRARLLAVRRPKGAQ